MLRALLVAAVDGSIGGVLVLGDRGTGKSTAVRALAALLPPMKAVEGCRFGCDPADAAALCDACRGKSRLRAVEVPVPVVDLPLGATEDRVAGALDIERALADGVKAFEPGLLARAHRGFLYIDEVNLLEDHLVDLLLDVAASGENLVEREGISIRHPARFVLVGSGNPEEGELRPQLLDRFGLCVEVRTPTDLPTRIEVIRRRDSYERDHAAFCAAWEKEQATLRRRILARACRAACNRSAGCRAGARRPALHGAWHRWAARGAHADPRRAGRMPRWRGRTSVGDAELRAVASPALRHRLRRNPLDETSSSTRVERAVGELFGAVSQAGDGRAPPRAAPDPAVVADQRAAALLLAVDPVGLGGVVLRAGPGPERDAWLALLRAAVPAGGRVAAHAGLGAGFTPAGGPRPHGHLGGGAAGRGTRRARRSRWWRAVARHGGTRRTWHGRAHRRRDGCAGGRSGTRWHCAAPARTLRPGGAGRRHRGRRRGAAAVRPTRLPHRAVAAGCAGRVPRHRGSACPAERRAGAG
jgi:magnesium chelatase subunit I